MTQFARLLVRPVLAIALATGVFPGGATPLFAQQGRGTILGTVTDGTGGALPGATVEVTNVGTAVTAELVSNEEGLYTAPNLPVGTYRVTVTLEGFKKFVRENVVLEVDQKARIDAKLEIGGIEETVLVTAASTTIDATTPTLGKVIENRRVQELPLNGRNALSLVMLAPGVQSGAGPNASGFGDRGTQVSLIASTAARWPRTTSWWTASAARTPTSPTPTSTPTSTPSRNSRSRPTRCRPSTGYTLGGVINLVYTRSTY